MKYFTSCHLSAASVQFRVNFCLIAPGSGNVTKQTTDGVGPLLQTIHKLTLDSAQY